MKKYILSLFILTASLASFAQYVALDISQQVRRDTERRQLTWDREDVKRNTTVSKNVTITVKSSANVELIVCLFYSSGGEVTKDFFTDKATSMKPMQKTFSPMPASEEEVRIAFAKYGWGKDYKRKSGDAKIMTCFCVFNKHNGKFLGMKSTSPKIEKLVKTVFAKDIADYVKQNKG